MTEHQVTTDISNLSISKDSRFIEVCVDQDVRLKRVSAVVDEPQTDNTSEYDLKDVNVARAKLDEADSNERVAEENVARLITILADESVERSGKVIL